MARDSSSLFGRLAVSEGLITAEQLKKVLTEQKDWQSDQPVPRLGELIAGKGWLTTQQVQSLLKLQQQRRAPVKLPGYVFQHEIGHGGMGTVYKARQASMDKNVAIKVLKPKFAHDKEYIGRFVREARSAGKLNHPNIVQGYDVGEAGGNYYFVMEFVDGRSVKAILAEDKALPERRALEIALQIARALGHAYKHGIIHRDVKPDNILINKEGTAKLADLGLAKSMDAGPSAVTMDGKSLGTPYYSSPEQAETSPKLDIRSDIYSLGATLYHMISGSVPFDAPSPAAVMAKHISGSLPTVNEMVPTFSPGAAAIVHKMMTKKPELRYQTPLELIEDIDRQLSGKSPAAQKEYRSSAVPLKNDRDSSRNRRGSNTTSHTRRLSGRRRPKKRSRAPLLATGITILLLAGAVAGYLLYFEDPNGGGPPKPPNGNGGATQAELEDRARTLLDAVVNTQETNPPETITDARNCISEYQKLLDDNELKTTHAYKAAQMRVDSLNTMIERLEASADRKLDKVSNAAATLAANDNRYGEAIAKLRAFASEYSDTMVVEDAIEKANALENRAERNAEQLITEARSLADTHEYDKAIAKLTPVIEDYGIETLKQQAEATVEGLEADKKAYEEEQAEKKKRELERQRRFNRTLAECDGFLRDFNWDQAAVKLDELTEEIVRLDEEKQEVARRRDYLDELRRLKTKAITALPECSLITLRKKGSKQTYQGKVVRADDDTITIRPVNGEDVSLKWTELNPDYACRALRAAGSVIGPEDGRAHLALALLLLLHDLPEKAQEELAKAENSEDDPGPRFEEIKKRIELAVQDADEREAIALHRKALQANISTEEAFEHYKELIEDHAETDYFGENEETIKTEARQKAQDIFDSNYPTLKKLAREGRADAIRTKFAQMNKLLGGYYTAEMQKKLQGLPLGTEHPKFKTPMCEAVFQMFAGDEAKALKLLKSVEKSGGRDSSHAGKFIKAMQEHRSLKAKSATAHINEVRKLEGGKYVLDDHERIAAMRLWKLLKPSDPDGLYRMVRYAARVMDYYRLDKPEWAEAALYGGLNAAGATSAWAKLRVFMGEREFKRGSAEKALRHFEAVKDSRASDSREKLWARIGIARCRIKARKDVSEAVKTMKKIVNSADAPADAKAFAWMLLGKAFETDPAKHDEALKAFENSYKALPDEEHRERVPESRHHAARLHAKQGEHREARELVRTIEQDDPGYYSGHKKELEALLK